MYFDRLGFYVQIEKRQTSFTVTKLNTVHNAIFTYLAIAYVCITSTENSKSRCKDNQEYLIDKKKK